MTSAASDTRTAVRTGVLYGVGLKVLSTLVFTCMIACFKAVAHHIPAGQGVFARSFFALLPILLLFWWRGELASAIRTDHLLDHFWRSLVGVISMVFWFACLALLPMPEAIGIGYASPLVTVVLAVLILGEVVRIYRWSAVIVGLVGILVILWPRLTLLGSGDIGSDAAWGAAFALTSACLAAFAMILVRRLVQHESTASIVIYFSATASLLSLASIPFGWVWPTPMEALLLVLAGLFGGIGQLLLTESYRHADASTIATFEYSSMLWGVLIGYLAFADVPTSHVVVGSAIVIASGLFIAFREHRLGLRRPPPPTPRTLPG